MVRHTLAEIIQQASVHQAELARRVGVSETYISLLARGLRVPGRAVLFKLCEALGVSRDEVEI